MSVCGFVLAAGRGERLRPLTDRMPKPLVPVNGGRMIDGALKWIAATGVQRVIVNLWYMKDQLTEYLQRRSEELNLKIVFSQEDELMGTGGGILNALKFVNTEYLLVHNSDVITDADPEKFVSTGVSKECHTLMMCVPYRSGTTPLWYSDGTILLEDKDGNSKIVTYAGVSFFRVDALRKLEVKKCGMIDGIVEPLMRRYGPAAGYLHEGLWCDGGTFEGLEEFKKLWRKFYANS